MRNFCLFAVLLAASVAVGQTYTRTNVQFSTQDITLQTGTTNAWKYVAGNPVCSQKTLAIGTIDNSLWCRGTDGYVYLLNRVARSWQRQGMGTAVLYLIVKDVNNVYSLQSVAHCGVYGGIQFYGFFRWIGSWHEQNSAACISQASIGSDDVTEGIGWDLGNNAPALFQSTDEGANWSLISDGFIFTTLNDKIRGCAIDATHGIWVGVVGNPLSSLPLLPSGTAAGCAYANYPTVVMAWNTASAVYVMPLENYGTWQAVTGLSAQTIVGNVRSRIFAEDASGKPYHWNINAATISSTWGGTWQGGCPTPSQPCNSGGATPTHTLWHQIKFRSGGSGQKTTMTQNWNTNFAVPASDNNPSCDPLFGNLGDPSCIADENYAAICNESGHTLADNAITLFVADSTDVENFAGNVSEAGPMSVNISGTGGLAGYYLGNVVNHIYSGCGITGPSTCPATDPADIILKGMPYLGPADEQRARLEMLLSMSDHASGLTAPYVYTSIFMAEELPDGTIDKAHAQCFADPSKPDGFLDGEWEVAPPCN